MHEMPDRETLKLLDFADYPKWYKQEHPDLFNAPAKRAAPAKKESPIEETPIPVKK
jgi:hypothetical protein